MPIVLGLPIPPPPPRKANPDDAPTEEVLMRRISRFGGYKLVYDTSGNVLFGRRYSHQPAFWANRALVVANYELRQP